MSQSTTIVLILLLITSVFLVGIFAVTQNTITAETVKQSCKLSISQKLFLDSGTGFLNPYDIECPRRIITVDNQQANILNSQELQKITKTTEYTYLTRTDSGITSARITAENYEQSLSEAIAYEMAECWDVFSRGEQDPLNRATWAVIPADTCFICAEFHFQKSPDVSVNVDTMLQETKHHFIDSTALRYPSYDDFLYGAPNQVNSQTCNQEQYVGADEVSVGPANPLAVVYYKHGFGAKERVLTSCSAVTVTPISQLPQECFAII